MDENINGEAARKRYDKFKPGAVAKASLNHEKDADLLKAIIKINGGIGTETLKGKAFWTAVANTMEEDIKAEAARKRFDKFKPKGDDSDGEDGDVKKKAKPKSKGAGKGKKASEVKSEDGTEVDDELEGPKISPKKATAKSKATRGAGKGKKAVESESDGSEEGYQLHLMTDLEDGAYMSEGASDGFSVPDLKVNKAALDALIAEGKANPPRKRPFVESWAEEVSSSSELALDMSAKKMKFDEAEDHDEI